MIRFYIPSFFRKMLIFPELITLYPGIYRFTYIFREWIREWLIFTEITDKIFYRISLMESENNAINIYLMNILV